MNIFQNGPHWIDATKWDRVNRVVGFVDLILIQIIAGIIDARSWVRITVGIVVLAVHVMIGRRFSAGRQKAEN